MPDHRSVIQSAVIFKNSEGVGARGTILRLSRSLVVFEVYNPYSIVQLSEVLEGFTIRRGERVIYHGRAVVSNLVNTGLLLIVSATLTDPWSDLAGLLETGVGVATEVRRFLTDFDSVSSVRTNYQLVVTTLRTFLSELGRWLHQVDLTSSHGDDPRTTLTDDVFRELVDPLFPRLTELFLRFDEEARSVPDEEITYHKAYAQRDLHPLLLRAPFVHRTYTKPLGYAGDFEMVNMMLRNAREGPTTYAQLLHTFYVSSKVCQAHRNRIEILKELLTITARNNQNDSPVRILNIGCGPAHELAEFVRTDALSERCTFELIDFSSPALDAARHSLEAAIQESRHEPDIRYVRKSVHALLKDASGKDPGHDPASFDMIYCAGLFDYLSDRVCSRLLSLFYKWLKPGGKMLVTNVHRCSEYRGVMEHILDWHLIYRDETQMKSLWRAPHHTRVYLDATGMNIFAEVRKPDAEK
jgi:extracellular factor (EF) 3-hydroxypalmitic acid methyl ester biosynthesis protein